MSTSSLCTREQVEALEDKRLGKSATRSTDPRAAQRLYACAPDELRTVFQRDYTRILHSRAFRRLRHKTQVFISPKNDHLCTRLEHSLHVASVASTIGNALRLNTDLISAIALGHDLGHAPFGHRGEECLGKLAKDAGLAGFSHELQSLRVVDYLDSPYPEHRGLNLTFAVRDGIVCHYGERFEKSLSPDRQKEPSRLPMTERGKDRPATLEGCVVRWADKVAYIGRDIEDAYTEELLAENDVPPEVRGVLGVRNREIIANLVKDIVANSADRDEIAVGDEVNVALNRLYQFSREKLYEHPKVTARFKQIDKAMKFLFGEVMSLIKDAQRRDGGCLFPDQEGARCIEVLEQFLAKDIRSWRDEEPAQLTVDYIAGMTDSFFTTAFEELFLPVGNI